MQTLNYIFKLYRGDVFFIIFLLFALKIKHLKHHKKLMLFIYFIFLQFKLHSMQKFALIFIIIILVIPSFAQYDFTLGHLQNLRDCEIYFNGINTVIRPATGVENELYDSLIFPKNDKAEKNWWVRKLFHEHLFIIGNDDYKVYVDPVFDFRYNRLRNLGTDEHIGGYTNTRGVLVHAKLSKYVYLNTSFYENQAVLPAYLEDAVYRYKGNIPGYARVKKLSGYSEFDYANAYGSISVKPIDCLNITLGYDRLFIGDGYHSMILSDFAAPMPYVKTNVKFGKWEYTNLVTRLMQYSSYNTNVETADKQSKVATYHLMTYNPQNGWQFTFFEQSVIDHKNKTFWGGLAQGIPVARIFLPLGVDNTNSKFGANVSYENKKIGIFYAQLALNETRFSDTICWHRQASLDVQIGYKNHNLFNVKNLTFLAEANVSSIIAQKHNSNYTGSFTEGNFDIAHIYTINTNYGQPLTIPQNTDGYIITAMLSYQIKQFKLLAKYEYSPSLPSISNNTVTNYPSDYFIYPKDCFDFQFIYEMNPVSRMQWFAGFTLYDLGGGFSNYYASIGFRTALRNNY